MAFYNCIGLKGTLIIPDFVTKIDAGAFQECKNLTKLVLGSSLKIINTIAFNHCEKLQGTLELPDSLEFIGGMSFCHCCELTSVIIKKNLTTIESYFLDDDNKVNNLVFSGFTDEISYSKVSEKDKIDDIRPN
jgi:hypothetical protein